MLVVTIQSRAVLSADDPLQLTAISAQGNDTNVAQLRIVQRDVLEPSVIVQRPHEEEKPLLPIDETVSQEDRLNVGMGRQDDRDSALLGAKEAELPLRRPVGDVAQRVEIAVALLGNIRLDRRLPGFDRPGGSSAPGCNEH